MPREKKQRLKQRLDGRFVCCYKGAFFYGRTSDEALQKRDDYKRKLAEEAQLEAEGMKTTQLTVYEYAKQWLPITKVGIRAHTYNGYAAMIDRLVDVIGTKLLVEVKPSDIKLVYATHYVGFSDSHIRHAKNLFTLLFDSAVDDGYIRINPCRSRTAKPPRGTAGTHRAITPTERYYLETTDHPVRPVAMLMLYAGLRDGEAIPIDIDRDVDLEEKEIHLRYFRHIEHNNAVIEKRGKNDYAARDIKLFPQLEKYLEGLHGLVISMDNGDVLTDRAWRCAWDGYVRAIERRMNGGIQKRWYGRRREDRERRIIYDRLIAEGKLDEAKQYELPPWRKFTVTPYDLRHSFCVMCRDLGVDINVCMKWMGHSDPTMILKVYDHVSDERIEANYQKICDYYSTQNTGNIVKMIVNK